MARNEARRQKQLAKKKAKRDEKRSYLDRQTSANPTIQLADAESWPIIGAWEPENLWSEGIGQLVIARRQPSGKIACAAFLVDVFCLGVKNAFWKITSEPELQTLLADLGRVGRQRPVAPEYLTKLIYDAVAYAESFGLAPHPDYGHARMLLAGIDPSLCADTFKFGQDGKPHYVRGPHESLDKAKVIAHKIHAVGGDFVIPLRPSEVRKASGALDGLVGGTIVIDEQL